MSAMREPEVDQVWRRKSDGLLCRVLDVSGRSVQYQGFRRQWKLIKAFVREFEYVGRAGAPPAPASDLREGVTVMNDAADAAVDGTTGVILVCAECRTPVDSQPCKAHQPVAYLEGFLSWAKSGARCKVPGFEDWIATPFNGWRQEGTGWHVTHGFLAQMMVDAGFRYDFDADAAPVPESEGPR